MHRVKRASSLRSQVFIGRFCRSRCVHRSHPQGDASIEHKSMRSAQVSHLPVIVHAIHGDAADASPARRRLRTTASAAAVVTPRRAPLAAAVDWGPPTQLAREELRRAAPSKSGLLKAARSAPTGSRRRRRAQAGRGARPHGDDRRPKARKWQREGEPPRVWRRARAQPAADPSALGGTRAPRPHFRGRLHHLHSLRASLRPWQ
jgi:hypothetical protein